MPSERTQRRIDRLLDDAEQALDKHDWLVAAERARDVLLLDEANEDAWSFLIAAERALSPTGSDPARTQTAPPRSPESHAAMPASFANGRYAVRKFLGEGGKKKVYLAHDTLLDRDVAFALIKTEGLDDIGRDRITREAQAMGRLGAHPHIVSVFDLGEEDGQPYIVTELMAGGDVEGLIEDVPDHRPSLERTLGIGIQVCRGLEFAHSHGIVHRDLKPGNVWLTADGAAKLGDFGLAVALDKSRLTQAGMMVGTVSYMPPEQAMGGEVTPRSDLYSLGAMLYEMVTGRPPFVGDESVAIITQHLNTAPVSPSWHNPSISPALETLILRLLQKDPDKRPASAQEVVAALSRIPTTATTAPLAPEGLGAVGAEALDQNPMYRRTFVGREQELHQLQALFDAAISGQGSLVMVVGEPGIGKTTLCEQLATYAVIRGGKTLIGHCYEEGSLSLPYLPFVEAMRSYVLAREPDGLRHDLGAGAGVVARIVSEVRERLQVEPNVSTADPEEERYRLFQAVSAFLQNAAMVHPLVIVLEDLHEADRGSLELLTHLSRNLAGTRLLLVGTYRDIEVDRAHPLSATLAELRRTSSFSRVLLRGLTADEVQRMLSTIAGQEVAWRLAEAVHRQTEGNPLFVQEVLRYLVEEGLIKREDGRWRRASGETPLEMGIPEGLRDVIGKRLSHLSPECNQALGIAAVIGREFGLATLSVAAGMAEETLDAAVEEALRVGVLEDRSQRGSVRFRFSHAFFRQTLYEELFTPRRLRLHQQVARALEEQYSMRLEEHAAELAEHFAQSSEPADLQKAVAYAELAARRALSVYAYGEAVRHLELALQGQEVLDPADKAKRCDLLLTLGEALIPAGDPLRAVEAIAPEALALAEALGDQARASRTCQLAVHSLIRHGAVQEFGTPQYQHWLEGADRYASAGSVDRVRTDSALASREYFGGRQRLALELAQQAMTLARALDDDEALFQAAFVLVNIRWPERQNERLRIAEEFTHRPQGRANAFMYGLFLCYGGLAFLTEGDRARAERDIRRVSEIAERTKNGSLLIITSEIRETLFEVIDGRLEEAVRAAEELRLRGEELGVPGPAQLQAFIHTLRARCYLGRAEEARAAQPDFSRTAVAEERSLVFGGDSALFLAHLGRWAEVRELLGRLTERLRADATFEFSYVPLTNYLEAAALAGDRELAALIRPRLAPVSALIEENFLTCVARHLGDASALLGEREQARAYYEQALEVCAKIRFRPEVALTRLQIAELLLDGADDAQRGEALGHLDFAIGELRAMKMQPSLARALRHKEVLKA